MADWEDYRYAAAVAEAGTVRGAAKALGVHASTVTRRIDHFERRLGVSLFTRSVRGLAPTSHGEVVVGAVRSVGAQFQEVERRLRRSNSEMAGEVGLSVSPALAAWLFMPTLKALLDEFPALSIRQHRSWTATAVETHEMDVAVVVSQQPPADLVGRPGGVMSLAGWATDELAVRWPQGCVWLPSRLQQETARDLTLDDAPQGSVLDTIELQTQAVLAGMGASLLPCYLAALDSRLVELPVARVQPEIWVLSHTEARGVRRIQTLASRLVDTIRQVDLRLAS
jgi:DNA-binding transcriptional LysR family regulator